MKKNLPFIFLSSCLAVVLFPGCTGAKDNHSRFWNPLTWGKASEQHALEGNKADIGKNSKSIEETKAKAATAANVEVHKALFAVRLKSYSPKTQALLDRLLGNSTELLDQVAPLKASDVADLEKLISDLLSENSTLVAAAEKNQAETEASLKGLSQRLGALQAQNDRLWDRNKELVADLQAGFDRENQKANDYRNLQFKFFGAIGLAVALLGLSLYLRIGLGSVGAGLTLLPKLIGKEHADTVVEELDKKTDWLHQFLVSSGRSAKEKALIAAHKLLGNEHPVVSPTP